MVNILKFKPEFAYDDFIINRNGEFITIFKATPDFNVLNIEQLNSTFWAVVKNLPLGTTLEQYDTKLYNPIIHDFYFVVTFKDIKPDNVENYCNQLMAVFESFMGISAERCTATKLLDLYQKINLLKILSLNARYENKQTGIFVRTT